VQVTRLTQKTEILSHIVAEICIKCCPWS